MTLDEQQQIDAAIERFQRAERESDRLRKAIENLTRQHEQDIDALAQLVVHPDGAKLSGEWRALLRVEEAARSIWLRTGGLTADDAKLLFGALENLDKIRTEVKDDPDTEKCCEYRWMFKKMTQEWKTVRDVLTAVEQQLDKVRSKL
jgi:predicted  nucleic acid-binding Zn-ribbon protein